MMSRGKVVKIGNPLKIGKIQNIIKVGLRELHIKEGQIDPR